METLGENLGRTYPLSPLQTGMLAQALAGQRPGLNVLQVICEMHEDLDVAAFARAWQLLVDRHGVFRTSFHWTEGGVPSQRVGESATLPFQEVDWTALPADEREAKFESFLEEDARRGFDMESPPLMRIFVIREGKKFFRFVCSVHHILVDGRSAFLALDEVFATYEAYREGREPVPAPAPPFHEYLLWHEAQDWTEAEAFWKGALEGFHTPTPLTVARPAQRVADHESLWAERQVELAATARQALTPVAKQAATTLNTVFQAAWAILLGRYSGEKEVVFGAVRAGRRPNVRNAKFTLGLFVNTLPIRIRVDGEKSLVSLLEDLRAQWLAMRPHEQVPLPRVQALSAVPRGERLFQTVLNYQDPTWDEALKAKGGAWLNRHFRLRNHADYSLGLEVYGGERFVLKIIYDPRLFDEATIDRMLGHLKTLLDGMAAHPDAPISELPLLTPDERSKLLEAWSQTGPPFAEGACVHEMIEARVAETPLAVAAEMGREQLTYQELDRNAGRLARHLRARGLKPGVFAGICLEASLDLPTAVLAILKAGGAYVPLDPDYPPERLDFMVEDSGLRVLLTHRSLAGRLARHENLMVFVDDPIAEEETDEPMEAGTKPDDPAYVIYTSGSTGRPKGVALPHAGACNLAVASHEALGVTRQSRVLQFASFSFDASVWEIFTTLTAGATLCMGTRSELLPGPELVRFLEAKKVNVIVIPPSLLAMLPEAELPHLKTVASGGEACSAELVERWAPDRRFINAYGPTEITVCATLGECFAGSGAIPDIGKPLKGVRVYIVDDRMEPAPIGVPGELCVGGPGVARGYLNRPELTGARFIKDPFSPTPGGLLYRSGDLVRFRTDGKIDYLGRIDDQVKMRGYRIELGEIEAALLEIEGIAHAAVSLRKEGGRQRLAAYLVFEKTEPASVPTVRERLQQRLPDYMVPSAFVVLEKLPLTPNGKIDRKALPAPEVESQGYQAPTTPAEEAICALFSSALNTPGALGTPGIGVDDNFFELGGDSLLATRISVQIQNQFAVRLPAGVLFKFPTVRELAREIERLPGKAEGSFPLAKASREHPLPLSFAQERVRRYCEIDSTSGWYRAVLILSVKGCLDVSLLERTLREVLRRHDILRTTFPVVDGQPVQFVNPVPPKILQTVDLENWPDAFTKVEMLIKEETIRPLDLANGPLVRASLLRLGENDHRFILTLHHTIYDGVSIEILFREIGALYTAYSQGQESPLSEPALHYGDFSAWQREQVRPGTPLYESQLAFWRTQLDGLDEASFKLPFQREVPLEEGLHTGLLFKMMPRRVHEELTALSKQHSVTLFMTLLAAYKALLHHHMGRDDIAIGTYMSNRSHMETETMIGMFSNLAIVRTDLSGDPDFLEILRRVRASVVEARARQDIPFDDLVEKLDLPPVRSFFLLSNVVSPPKLPGLNVRRLARFTPLATWGFTYSINNRNSRLVSGVPFDTALYDPARVEAFILQFNRILENIARDPRRRISDLLPPPAEDEERAGGGPASGPMTETAGRSEASSLAVKKSLPVETASSPRLIFLYPPGTLARLQDSRAGSAATDIFFGAIEAEKAGWQVEHREVQLRDWQPYRLPFLDRILSKVFLHPEGGRVIRGSWKILREALPGDCFVVVEENLSFGLAFWRLFLPGRQPLVCVRHRLSHGSADVRRSLIPALVKRTYSVFFGQPEAVFPRQRFGLKPAQFTVSPPAVDDEFWTPGGTSREFVLVVGESFSDYDTLLSAASRIPGPIRIVSSRKFPANLPANVTVKAGGREENMISDGELRELYRRAVCVVIPLEDTTTPAGQSVCLQAMSCGRPVILTRTRDFCDDRLRHEENLLLVNFGDAEELAHQVNRVLCDRLLALRLGKAARSAVRREFRMADFSARLREICGRLCAGRADAPPAESSRR